MAVLAPRAFTRSLPCETLLRLPNELLCMVGSRLDGPRDTNALLQCNRRLHTLLTPQLHAQATQDHGRLPSYAWAAMNGHVSLLRLLAANPHYDLDLHAALDCCMANRQWRWIPEVCDCSALFLAVQNGHEDVVRLLLLAGAGRGERPSAFLRIFAWESLGLDAAFKPESESGSLPSWNIVSSVSCSLPFAAVMGGHAPVLRTLMEWGECADLDEARRFSKTAVGRISRWDGVLECLALVEEEYLESSMALFSAETREPGEPVVPLGRYFNHEVMPFSIELYTRMTRGVKSRCDCSPGFSSGFVDLID